MNKILNKLIWLIILAPGIYLAITWKKIPEIIPVHFDIKGNADRLGHKKELLITVIILSVVSTFVFFLLSNIFRIDPKKYAPENKDRLQRIGFAIAVFMAAINCMIIYSGVNGGSRFDVRLILAAVGLLFAIIGNYMPNMKPNYFAGIRLPWTLENADNWRKTHALAGKYWFFGGLLIPVLCLPTPPEIALFIFFFITIVITVIPCVYSYRLYKKQKITNTSN